MKKHFGLKSIVLASSISLIAGYFAGTNSPFHLGNDMPVDTNTEIISPINYSLLKDEVAAYMAENKELQFLNAHLRIDNESKSNYIHSLEEEKERVKARNTTLSNKTGDLTSALNNSLSLDEFSAIAPLQSDQSTYPFVVQDYLFTPKNIVSEGNVEIPLTEKSGVVPLYSYRVSGILESTIDGDFKEMTINIVTDTPIDLTSTTTKHYVELNTILNESEPMYFHYNGTFSPTNK